jgi:hypothetical protein
MSWGRWGRTSVSRAKTSRPAISRVPIRAPARCYPGLAVLTRNAWTLVPGARCPRCDSNAHCRSPRDRDSCRFGLRGHGASAPPRTGCLRLTGSALWPGELQRLELGNLGSNQEPLGSGPSALPIAPFPIKYAGRDLNPQTARFELASFTELALPAPVCAARDLNPDRDTG